MGTPSASAKLNPDFDDVNFFTNQQKAMYPLKDFIIPLGSPSVLTGIHFQERVDEAKLAKLLNCNSSILHEYTGAWGNRLTNEKTHLQRILHLALKGQESVRGKMIVPYHFGSSWSGYGMYAGRVYASGSLSLGCLRAELRGFLTQDKYIDFDFENCHPSFLYQVSQQHEMELPMLKEYCDHRYSYLQTMTETLKTTSGAFISRKRAKNLFLRILYGGSMKMWKEGDGEGDEPINNYDDLPEKDRTFHKEFASEQASLVSLIVAKNPRVVDEYIRLGKTPAEARRSTASLFAQCGERLLLETMFEALVKIKLTRVHPQRMYLRKNTHDCILCFDGIMILKEYIQKRGMTFDAITNDIQSYIRKKLGYSMVVVEKPINFGYTEAVINDHIGSPTDDIEVFSNDHTLRLGVLRHFGKYIKVRSSDASTIYVYNEKNGMWSSSYPVSSLVMNNPTLFPRSIVPVSNEIVYWAGKTKALLSALSVIGQCEEAWDDEWFKDEVQTSSLGKILFQDGYFNFHTNTFTKGYTHEIVFHHQANIPFEMVWDEEEAGGTLEDIQSKLTTGFCDLPAFDGNLSLHAHVHYLARGMAGDNLCDRVFVCATGKTSCGKGTITSALGSIFGDYVVEINTGNLCVSQGMESAERRLGFLVDSQHARIMIANEHPRGKQLSSALLKTIASGGDKISGRKAYGRDASFCLEGLLVLYSNSLVSAVDECCEALLVRARVCNYDKSFVKEVKYPERENLIDPSFKETLRTNPYVQHAFLKMLIHYYYHPPAGCLEYCEEITKSFMKSMDDKSCTMGDYLEITLNEEDFMTNEELVSVYKLACENDRGFYRTFKNTLALKTQLEENMGVRKVRNYRKTLTDKRGKPLPKGGFIWVGVKEVGESSSPTSPMAGFLEEENPTLSSAVGERKQQTQ